MAQAKQDWSVPVTIKDVDFAFPAKVIGAMIPEWRDLPQMFQDETSGYESLASHACYYQVELRPDALRVGIDATLATRQLNAVARSFEPTHEHKIAGLAYLLSLWLSSEDDENTTAKGSDA